MLEGPSSAVRAALSVRGLSVSFGGVAALRDVTLDVAPGEVVAVIGPNGAGKSTLLNAVLGLVPGAVSGEVELFGTPAPKAPASRVRLGIGRSFQHPPLLDEETVVENVLVGAEVAMRHSLLSQVFWPRAANAAEREFGERALELLDTMGLREIAGQPVGSLPYGVRKLVDLARTLVASPRLVMLDEPTSGVHGADQERVNVALRVARQQLGAAILLVEHHMHIVREHADRVVALQAGRVLSVGTPTEVLESEVFREVIVGQAQAVGAENAEAPERRG